MSDNAAKTKAIFGVTYDPAIYQLTHFKADEPYSRPEPLVIDDLFNYVQPWSGYSNHSTRAEAHLLPAQTANIKPSMRYRDAELGGNKWMELACSEALKSVQAGGGPFSSVIVQIDDDSNRVIRYWISWNHVTEWSDPTAHGEITGIRQACQELGVFNLGQISKNDPKLKLPQTSATSHCELYTSAEPCPMCYAATRWSRIDYIYFAATVFDAAAQGVRFSDEPIYAEISLNYAERRALGAHCFQCTVPNSLDAFNHFKRSESIKY